MLSAPQPHSFSLILPPNPPKGGLVLSHYEELQQNEDEPPFRGQGAKGKWE
jgi:hypothetical protein